MAIYMWRTIPPGIYHNSTLGLITLMDGNGNDITIADKNLGATTVYNDGDTLSQSNCGKCYQRGNNYGFPFTGTVTTSWNLVDTTNYGPGNYYSSSTFIIVVAGSRSSSADHNNLRGGVTGTNSAMQGPCANGYHIPLYQEFSKLKTITNSLGLQQNGSSLKTYLKMPYSGYRWHGDTISRVGTEGYLYCSNLYNSNTPYGIDFSDSQFYVRNELFLDYAAPIRPFSNELVQPDNSRTKLY